MFGREGLAFAAGAAGWAVFFGAGAESLAASASAPIPNPPASRPAAARLPFRNVRLSSFSCWSESTVSMCAAIVGGHGGGPLIVRVHPVFEEATERRRALVDAHPDGRCVQDHVGTQDAHYGVEVAACKSLCEPPREPWRSRRRAHSRRTG